MIEVGSEGDGRVPVNTLIEDGTDGAGRAPVSTLIGVGSDVRTVVVGGFRVGLLRAAILLRGGEESGT